MPNPVMRSSKKFHIENSQLSREVSTEILDILLSIADDDDKSALASIDEKLGAVMKQRAELANIVVAGSARDVYRRRMPIDVHVPIADGLTLTIGVSGKDATPNVFDIGANSQIDISHNSNNSTVEYYNTATVNSGMDDIQGDSRSD